MTQNRNRKIKNDEIMLLDVKIRFFIIYIN